MRKKSLLLLFLYLVAVPCLRAQTDSLLREGERLHRLYRFEEAIAQYAAAAAQTRDDDTLSRLRTLSGASQNALNMTDFCADPVVVARQRFSRRDFFLYYPLKNQSWRSGPNILDPSEGPFPLYAPKGGRSVCYSAPDASGFRNLYVIRDQDSLWSAPALMGEKLLSLGNEAFPMLSPDGKTLTFASDGFYGMGGYDLYTSTWDEETGTWGEPVNLGFPFSSPGDDFLLTDSPDGRYTLFASNRDCSRDSVYIYVVEKQAVPVRIPVRDPEALSRLCSLYPLNDPARQNHAAAVAEDVPESDDTRLYRQLMAESRILKDTLYVLGRELDEMKVRLAADDGTARTGLSEAIVEKEAAIAPLQARLEETARSVRAIEQSFLKSGVVGVSDRADREVVGARSSYTFSKNAFGAKLRLKLADPPQTEETFRVAPVGRFAQETVLPSGVVYQILLFTSVRHATLDEIGGLSPVYERITSSLRYTYSVGVFKTFDEALSRLNPVRHLGFPEAQIVAFIDGRPVPVRDARRAE